VAVRQVGESAEVTVRDTGKGISPEFLPYVFNPFRQADAAANRRFGGLGLGLAICKHLVELHGGTIRAESEGEGHGATFVIALPVDAKARPAHQEGAPPQPASSIPAEALSGMRVLVVDDEQDTLNILRRALEQARAEVTTAPSAAAAYESFREGRPDVVLADIAMPEEDGYSLIRRIRELSPEEGGRTPAVAVTAFARAEDGDEAISAGFQVHVPKPVDPGALVELLARVVRRDGSAE
jgi:CheY-like chemotaxis protein